MNELVPWVMCQLFGLIAQARRHGTAGNTNPCGVINGTPHGFLFDTKTGRWLIRDYLGRDHETKKRNYHNIHGSMRRPILTFRCKTSSMSGLPWNRQLRAKTFG
jgi:hypothetical protein